MLRFLLGSQCSMDLLVKLVCLLYLQYLSLMILPLGLLCRLLWLVDLRHLLWQMLLWQRQLRSRNHWRRSQLRLWWIQLNLQQRSKRWRTIALTEDDDGLPAYMME